jgi:DNA-binding MarR family transcriptional regulator
MLTMTSQRLGREIAAQRGRSKFGTTSDGSNGGDITSGAERRLHQMLDVLERRALSPTEARILLTLRERDAAIAELSHELGLTTSETWRASARLARRGLLSWAHRGERKRATVAITPAGLGAAGALVDALCTDSSGNAGLDPGLASALTGAEWFTARGPARAET